MKQELWANKGVFILAAIGSAAGLGNIWKFPFLVFDNGGGAFIIAYLVMLLLVGLGLLIGEIALGQKTRSGIAGSLGSISKYFKWVGWATVGFAFTILTYYMVVVGWGMDYLYYSIQGLFTGSLPWAGDSSGFFYNNVLGLTGGVGEAGSLSKTVLIGTIVGLILTYFFTYKSAKSVGKVVLVTATLPFLTLVVLAIKGMTLPGSSEGINYLTSIDTSKLFELSTWSAAGGQIFFTLSVAMGVMFAYGAMKQEKSEIVKATFIVALGNTLISFLSAIAVFGTLGYLAGLKGVNVEDVVSGGPGLVFTVLPETLAQFASFSALFSVIFFLTIFMLAIDSAMSLVEAVVVPLKIKFQKVSTEIMTLIVIVLVGLGSTIYMSGNGLYILDIVDHYITQLGMLVVGLIELLLFVYAYKSITKYIDEHNELFNKSIINGKYFVFSWLLGIVVIVGLLLLNLNQGYFVYDSYSKVDLLTYGFYPIMLIFVISIVVNIFEKKA